VRRAYKTLYREGLSLEDARAKLESDAASEPVLAPLAAFLVADRARHRALAGGDAMHDAAGGAAPVTVGIVAGEASGDALGATLIEAVRERMPHVRFAGIAGPKMAAAGCDVWVPSEKLAVRGLVEVVRHLPGLVAIRRALTAGSSPSACRCSSASTRRTSTWASSASSSAAACARSTS
jgi:hypothetical protein